MITDAIQSPFEKLVDATMAPVQTASLQMMVRLGVADALAATQDDEGAELGLTVNEIAEKVDVDPERVRAPIQLLTAMGWFEEGEDSKYRTNRFSEELRAGQ